MNPFFLLIHRRYSFIHVLTILLVLFSVYCSCSYAGSTPPYAITTLSAETGSGTGEIDLSWIAPGDDGTTGTAQVYDIRYATIAVQSPASSTTTFINSNSVSDFINIPDPQSAGTYESVTVSSLTGGVTYYFAIRSSDEQPNVSGLSNQASAIAQTQGTLSLSVSPSNYEFGIIDIPATAISVSSITVSNTGNTSCTFSMSCSTSSPAVWTPVTVSSPSTSTEFRLLSIFNGNAQPGSGNFSVVYDYLNTLLRSSSADNFSGSETGESVPADVSRGLWFRFETPIGNPSSQQQTIAITINAESP